MEEKNVDSLECKSISKPSSNNSFAPDISFQDSNFLAQTHTARKKEENINNQEINLSRKLEFEKGIPLTFGFVDNKIFTIPFSFSGHISFVFKKLSETPFNLCLIFVFLYYLISFLFDMDNLRDLNLFLSISFHLFIIIIQIILTTIEYISIYINDNKVNNQKAHIYDNEERKFVDSTWKEIKVGHIIKVLKNEVVPADIILLESMDLKHQCYLDNSSINGNFNMFKIKKACNDTQAPNMKVIKFSEYVKNIKGILKYEEPNSNMNSFKGRLKLENFPRASDINQDNFVVRGATLKNVRYIYGLVVYTGMETKMMMTLKYTEIHENKGEYTDFTYGNTNQVKKNQFNSVIIKKDNEFIRQSLKRVQYWIIIVYLVILIVILLMGIHKGVYLYLSEDDYSVHVLGYPYEENLNDNSLYEIFLGFTRAVLTFHFFMPFNWFGLIKISYYILSLFSKWDENIKRNKNEKAEIINSESLANFGQVRHILTDKTGTLTKRKVELKLCSIHGKLFSFQFDDVKNDNYIFKIKEDDINELEVIKELNSKTTFSPLISEFIEALSICHSVKAIHLTNNYNNNNNNKNDDNNGNNDNNINKLKKVSKNFIKLKSSSSFFDNFAMKMDEFEFVSAYCEEVATLKILNKFGYKLLKSKRDIIQFIVNNKYKNYVIYGINLYQESRKRMSIVIKKTVKKSSVLLCKAYDISAFDLVRPEEIYDLEIEKAKKQIEEISKFGSRYFILFKRELNEEETSNFLTKYKSAENYVAKSEEHLNSLAIEYEINLTFLGIVFFEESKEPNLKYSMSLLKEAGIKIWIASGDNKENVLSVGKALDLYDPNSIWEEFSDEDKPEDLDIKMSTLLIQFLFPNDKFNKVKTRSGNNLDLISMKETNSKTFSILLSGNCFSRICKDHRNYQSLATLLSYCTYLLAYQFSPNNKLVLCQMIKNYCSKNSRLLAVGDGFNDFSMLREADLSVGIISKEILQLRNTCDVIVSNISQIVDLILVHGTWNYKKILKISVLSFYLHFLLLFPKLFYLNENFSGFSFYDGFNFIFTLNMLVLNLYILFMITFDIPVERDLITLNKYIYMDNIYDDNKLVFSFGIQILKSFIDSGIIYIFNKNVAGVSINALGKNVDMSLFGNQIIYTSYSIVIIKVLTLNLKYLNCIHFFITIICIGFLTSITFLDAYYQDSVIYGITHFTIILINLLAIFICCLYEVVARYVLFLLDFDFLSKLTNFFKERMSKFLFLKDFEGLLTIISLKIPRIFNKLDKLTFPEVLNNIYKINKQLDPALENLADVSSDEASDLRIRKPFLKFFDQRVEMDYIDYCDMKITIPYLLYLLSLILFFSIDVVLRGFELQKIGKIAIIAVGFLLFIPKLKQNFSLIFPFYFAAILIIELLFIYLNKRNNDLKICLQTSILINFPLYYCQKKEIISIIIILYIAGITPAIFINDYGMNKINDVYQEKFLYKNLCLIYLRQMSIYGVVFLIFISSYYTCLKKRIEFLKYHKSKRELKKDNLIITNLIPEFVRDKIKKGERGVASGYEEVSIVFCDIYNFDSLMAKLSPKEIILLLDQFYSLLDQFCQIHGLQKIETVGKTYMAAGGIKECEVGVDNNLLIKHHSIRCFEFALDILDLSKKMIFNSGNRIHVKIGIHKGKIIPAVVGAHKPQFSLIGDAVNTTSRMSSNGEEDCITCSEFAYEEIKSKYKENFTVASKYIKGKGPMNLYSYNIPKRISLNLEKRKSNFSKDKFNILQSKTSLKNIQAFIQKATKYSKRKYQIIQNIDSSLVKGVNSNNSLDNNSLIEDSMLIVENSQDMLLKTKKNEMDTLFKDLNLFNNDTNAFIFNYSLELNKNNDDKINKKYTIEKREPKFEQFRNDIFSDSFLLYGFKNEVSKINFISFENIALSKSIKKSIYINLTLFFVLLYSVYIITHYTKINEDYFPYLTVKSTLILLLVLLIFSIDKLIESFPKLKFIIFTLTYLLISINNMFYNEKLNTFNLINMTAEEIVILTVIETCGILNYYELSVNIFFHIVIYIVDILTNGNNLSIRNYNIFLIVISVIKFINIITLYYDMTSIFLTNQKETKILADTEKMLFNLMPLHAVQNMKDDIPVADVIENVTLLYADIVNYTKFGNSNDPVAIVKLLMLLFKEFDNATKICNVYKVHTIGDCYVVMGFNGKVSMKERNYHQEAKNVCKMGKEMIRIIKEVRQRVKYEDLDMRIGIHSGTVIAGIIGSSVVRYDIFGSDVLIANKMESAGQPGKINISEETKKLLETNESSFKFSFNKEVFIDSFNGTIKCYLIDN